MIYSIELSEEYVEKLFSLVGYEDSELDDELEVQDALKTLLEEL